MFNPDDVLIDSLEDCMRSAIQADDRIQHLGIDDPILLARVYSIIQVAEKAMERVGHKHQVRERLRRLGEEITGGD